MYSYLYSCCIHKKRYYTYLSEAIEDIFIVELIISNIIFSILRIFFVLIFQYFFSRSTLQYTTSDTPFLPMRNNLQGTTSSIKPPRHSHSRHFAEKNFARKCSWRCIAIFFVVLAVILSAALAYITGKFFKSFLGFFPLNNSMFCKNRNVTLKVLLKNVTAHQSTH